MENEVKEEKVETKKKGNGLFTLFACVMTGIIVFLATNLGDKAAKTVDPDTNSGNTTTSNVASNVESNVTSNVESNVTSNTTSNTEVKTVTKVEMVNKELDSKTIAASLDATTATGEVVWKVDLGKIPVGTGVYTLGYEVIGNNVYLNNYGKLEKRNMQTGEIIWKATQKEENYSTPTIKEANGNVYVESGMGAGYVVEILDGTTGKSIKLIENIDGIIPEAPQNNQHYIDTSSMTINGNNITFTVNLNDASGKFIKVAGYVVIDSTTGKIAYKAA